MPLLISGQTRIARFAGSVAGASRMVETWSAPPGFLLRMEGLADFYISPDGLMIQPVREGMPIPEPLDALNWQAYWGPVKVFALALRGTWALHASAVMLDEKVFVFLGESGYGKSTLAASLAKLGRPGLILVADDILPATSDEEGLWGWPHFPQLKLPPEAQPSLRLPEKLPLAGAISLQRAAADENPSLARLSAHRAAQGLLAHTAGTRMFPPELLARHLAFCARAAGQLPVYEMRYPHRRDVFRDVLALLAAL